MSLINIHEITKSTTSWFQGRSISDEEVRQMCYQILREQMEDLVADLRGPPGPPGVGKPGKTGAQGIQGPIGSAMPEIYM